MSDVNGATAESIPAPAETGAPISDGASLTQPLGSQIPAAAQTKEAPPSIDDSIDRAMAKSEERAVAKAAGDKKPADKPTPKEQVKAEQPRESGKFAAHEPAREPPKEAAPIALKTAAVAAKPSYTAGEPPKRFSEDAKAEWASLPEKSRGEISRMERELTQGYEKHRANSEAYESYRELDDIAKSHGKNGAEVFREYYNMENLLRKDLVGGLDEVCSRMGYSLRDVAAHVLSRTPDQTASQQDATIRELRANIQRLEQQIGGVTTTIQEQQQSATLQEVTKFAQDNPRFEELADDIAFFMKSGRAKDLSEAYELAERLNPAPRAPKIEEGASSAPTQTPDRSVQTDKGQKSINGAPTAGSSPAGKKRVALSLDESLDRAFGRAG